MSINNLDMELTTSKKQHQVYVSAKTFIDKRDNKKRGNGKNYNMQLRPTPLSFEAETFTILPDKRIIGQNVTLFNPVFFFPLGFWSPTYIFELGKRKVIYLMPVIGTNAIEGSFFKNQIDYVLNDHWTGEAFIDTLSNKGIGIGTQIKL